MSKVWLQRQKKGDLIDLADSIGFTKYEGLLKVDLEIALQAYLAENAARLSSDPRLALFYSRPSVASPIKREPSSAFDNGESTVLRRSGRPVRRVIKAVEDISAAITSSPSVGNSSEGERSSNDSEPAMMITRARSAARTPGRPPAIQSPAQIPLPPSPAVIAANVERQTALIRRRISSQVQESGIVKVSEITRDTLSTVTSIHILILAFEGVCIRKAVLPDRVFFNFPAIRALHTREFPIKIPDFFLLLESGFWKSTLLWIITSLFIPLLASYFINFSLANSAKYKAGRPRPVFDPVGYALDPLTYNIVKALVVYAVFGTGYSFWGLVDETSVATINEALGWFSVLVGTAIGGLVTIYEALLRK